MIRSRGHYWQVKVYAGRDPLTGARAPRVRPRIHEA
jgi:hypothetical protein